MLREVVTGMVCLLMCGLPAAAEDSADQGGPAAVVPPLDEAPHAMEDPRTGDRWTYETRDEITGTVKATLMNVVTEVTATTVSVRLGAVGSSNFAYVTYDRAWNVINDGNFKYTPNDGGGVRLPLEVGKKWSIRADSFNSAHGITNKRSGTSKVTGLERITTRAGTFDAFKIETSYTDRNAGDPTKKFEATWQTWYVPAIDHWVKRVLTQRTEGQVRNSYSMELVEFGRR